MKDLLRQGIKIIINSNFSDNFEYVSTIISILLAAVAIWATVYTTRKQNKTALFEKRLEVFKLIGFIANYSCWLNQTSFEFDLNDEYDDKFEFLLNQNKLMFSSWVNQRLIFAGTYSNSDREDLMTRALKGNMDNKLCDIMWPYLLQDISLLQQGEFIFKPKIAQTIRETEDAYYKLIDNLFMLPNGNGAHSVDNAEKYFNSFQEVGSKWQEQKIEKMLKKDMNII